MPRVKFSKKTYSKHVIQCDPYASPESHNLYLMFNNLKHKKKFPTSDHDALYYTVATRLGLLTNITALITYYYVFTV